MKKLIIFVVLVLSMGCATVKKPSYELPADQDTGSYTTNEYFYKLGRGDWGDTPLNKWTGALDKADKALKSSTILEWSLEYPTSGDNFGARRVPYATTITKVLAVLQADANENVTINIKHGTDRSSGTYLLSSDQAISSTTTGDSFTSFSDATLVAEEWAWLTVTANSGVVEGIDITVEANVD